MEDLPNIEPTRVDPSKIEQYEALNDSTDLLNEIERTSNREERIEVLRRSQFFSNEKAKFKEREAPKNAPPTISDEEKATRRKIIVAVLILIIMIIIIICVVKKHNRIRREEAEAIASNEHFVKSMLTDFRQTDLGHKTIIAGEIFFYFLIILGIAYMLNKIVAQANQVVKS